MAASDTELISPAERIEKTSPPLLLSGVALLGSILEGACAILVASASAKLLVGLGAAAAAVKASRFHADAVRIPVLLISAAAALLMLLVLWNGWRARNRSAARWRQKPLTIREKLGFSVTFLASLVTLALVVSEVIVHPIFHIR